MQTVDIRLASFQDKTQLVSSINAFLTDSHCIDAEKRRLSRRIIISSAVMDGIQTVVLIDWQYHVWEKWKAEWDVVFSISSHNDAIEMNSLFTCISCQDKLEKKRADRFDPPFPLFLVWCRLGEVSFRMILLIVNDGFSKTGGFQTMAIGYMWIRFHIVETRHLVEMICYRHCRESSLLLVECIQFFPG